MSKEYKRIKLKLVFACVVTLALLVILPSILLTLFFLALDSVTFSFFLSIVFAFLLINLLLLLTSPVVIGWQLSSGYGQLNWVTPETLQDSHTLSFYCIRKICRKYKIIEPKLLIVNDKLPFAFTYGYLPQNARIVVSSELLRLLEDEELAAVFAHELGHIICGDFAVMNVAQVLVIASYNISLFSSNSDNIIKVTINLLSIIFHVIGFYLSLYLSRIREFSADSFAARNIENPNDLSKALLKVSYATTLKAKANTPISGLRALNISDLDISNHLPLEDRQDIQSFLIRLLNFSSRWATWCSTHPSLKQRIDFLQNYSEQKLPRVELDLSDVSLDLEIYEKRRIKIYDSITYSSSSTEDKNYVDLSQTKIILERSVISYFFWFFVACGMAMHLLFPILIFPEVLASPNLNSILLFISILALCTLMGIAMFTVVVDNLLPMFSPDYLSLSSQGVEVKNFSTKTFVEWSKIQTIEVETTISFVFVFRSVGITFFDEYKRTRRETGFFARLYAVLFGNQSKYDIQLSSYYKNPHDLASTLNKWKKIFLIVRRRSRIGWVE
jgi:Zn-dependent protease with chaperone function